MKILVTGASGFLGKNLETEILSRKHTILKFDIDTPQPNLFTFVEQADFIVHLAGINRPLSKDEFYQGNSNFTFELIETIKRTKNRCPIIFSSSIQATLSNDYGKSKKMAEDYLFTFQKECGNKVFVFRLSNLFGKWSKPNYNSVIATFCYNVIHGIPLKIDDTNIEIPFVYVDDVVKEFLEIIEGQKCLDTDNPLTVAPIYPIKIGQLADFILSFKNSRVNLSLPNTSDEFLRKLYATYMSFIEPQDFAYSLKTNIDGRGSFSEIFKTEDRGQISINVTLPGITKGNHYHNTKCEKFLVVSGDGLIRFRKIGTIDIISHFVSGKKLMVVDIPPGYTHSISNVGTENLITIMWASELFNPEKPDTIFEVV